jgi:outer membrane protein assembly factor BamD
MRHSLAVFLLVTLTACSSTPDELSNRSAEELYNEAKSALQDSSYEGALRDFKTLQSRFPYSRYAQQAQLEIAYVHFKQNAPDATISAANRFIQQYPKNSHVDYAFYLKGLANFNADIGMFGEAFGQDPTERDPKAAQDSFESFKDLISRFPNSKYAPDSRLRMQYLINALASYEIHVASYYLRRNAFISAINRANNVLTQFPNSTASKDALMILVQGYDALGMAALRTDSQRVLNLNFPRPATTTQ